MNGPMQPGNQAQNMFNPNNQAFNMFGGYQNFMNGFNSFAASAGGYYGNNCNILRKEDIYYGKDIQYD